MKDNEEKEEGEEEDSSHIRECERSGEEKKGESEEVKESVLQGGSPEGKSSASSESLHALPLNVNDKFTASAIIRGLRARRSTQNMMQSEGYVKESIVDT